MRDYLSGVFLLSALFGLLEKILYGESGSLGEKKALAIILIFAVTAPLPTLISAEGILPDFSDIGKLPEGEYSEVTREAFEEGLQRALCDEFSLKKDGVTVRCFGFSFEKMRAERISVVLSLSAAGVDPDRVKKYINDLDIGECEVQFEIG